MSNPQQPEIRRSERGEIVQDAAQARTGQKGRTGPVPEDNQPGHHPEHEQDQPDLPA